MNPLREAAQQSLEALKDLADCGAEAWSEQRPCVQIGREAIIALRAAPAQQAEPVEPVEPAELRRLHEENASLTAANEAFGKRQEWCNEKMFTLEQQRDALLEALKEVVPLLEEVLEITDDPEPGSIGHKARAAIKAVEEGK